MARAIMRIAAQSALCVDGCPMCIIIDTFWSADSSRRYSPGDYFFSLGLYAE